MKKSTGIHLYILFHLFSTYHFFLLVKLAGGDNANNGTETFEPIHYLLEKELMKNYNSRLIPRREPTYPIAVYFSVGLYQIIEVQYVLLNSWVVERWKDDMLYWNPEDYNGLSELVLPRELVWTPDTTLYNSLVMNDEDSKRSQRGCNLQHCALTFGSWAHDNKGIDYFPHNERSNDVTGPLTAGANGMGIEHCIENEGWNMLATTVERKELKFECCANNYTLLEYYLHMQRKPLYYLVNLIAPTSVITLIALIGFFSSSTVNDAREEKISLGITTLLSMSILIFLVSDQMPSTSSFIPLIGWFYTAMMLLISGATLASSFVIYVQKKGIVGQRPSSKAMRRAKRFGRLILMEMPLLMKQAYMEKAREDKLIKRHKQQLAANASHVLHEHRRLKRYQQGACAGKARKRSLLQILHKFNQAAFASLSHHAHVAPPDTIHTLPWSVPFTRQPSEGDLLHFEEENCVTPQTKRHEEYASTKPALENVLFSYPKDKSPAAVCVETGRARSEEREPVVRVQPKRRPMIVDVGGEGDSPWYSPDITGFSTPTLPPHQGEHASVVQTATNKARPYVSRRVPLFRQATSTSIPYEPTFSYAPSANPSGNPTATTEAAQGAAEPGMRCTDRNNLAQLEYDWLAAVIERLFLLIFLVLFFLLAFGINGIGLFHYCYYGYMDVIPHS